METVEQRPRIAAAPPARTDRAWWRRCLDEPLLTNAYALAANSGISATLGLVYWILAAQLYSDDVVGINSAAIALMMFISAVAQLNLPPALARFIPASPRQAGKLVASSYAISASLGLVIVGGYFILFRGSRLFEQLLGNQRWIALLFVMGVASWCVFALQDGALAGFGRALWVPVENAVFGIAKLVLLVVLASVLSSRGIFVSWTLPILLFVAPVNYLIFRRLVPRQLDAPVPAGHLHRSDVVSFVTGNYLAGLFALAVAYLPPVLVLDELGAESTAYFYVAWAIGHTLILAVEAFAVSLTVEGAARPVELGAYARRMTRQALVVFPAIVAAIILLAPTLLDLFGSAYRSNATDLLRLLAVAVLLRIPVSLFAAAARVRGQVVRIAIAESAIAITALVLIMLLIADHGLIGVGWAILIAQAPVALAVIPFLVALVRSQESTVLPSG